MVTQKNENGMISIDNSVYTNLAGHAAVNCFGVKGMAVRSISDGLVHLLRREAMSKGVEVTINEDNSITVELHIMVDRGVNLPAISDSIVEQVRYNVTKSTGTEVRAINVFVDSVNPK